VRYPTNRLVGSRPASDIKTPRKKPETTGTALKTSEGLVRKNCLAYGLKRSTRPSSPIPTLSRVSFELFSRCHFFAIYT